MKAADLKPGDTIRSGEWDGWTVTELLRHATNYEEKETGDGILLEPIGGFVLLTLERFKQTRYGPHSDDVNVDIETRRTWFMHDEDLEVT